ncbi:MAG: monovalent cation/H(+) antiporter subunit G [Synechococcales cyanobacterium RM1_1_8]|nr:monovalent cation/H(+) antiporter subunit G [Synechococcales cyanobacterium RM1_1_8]
MIDIFSYGCIAVGLWFWLWGTWPLLGHRSVLYKLHGLSVADTLGSMLIVVGLLMKIPREWPLLMLALISLAIWNTVLGYVLAYCAVGHGHGHGEMLEGADTQGRTVSLRYGKLFSSGNSREVSHDG